MIELVGGRTRQLNVLLSAKDFLLRGITVEEEENVYGKELRG